MSCLQLTCVLAPCLIPAALMESRWTQRNSAPQQRTAGCLHLLSCLFSMSEGDRDSERKTLGVGPAGRKDVPGPDKGRTGCRSRLRAGWALWSAARSASDREKWQWSKPPRPHTQGGLISHLKGKQTRMNWNGSTEKLGRGNKMIACGGRYISIRLVYWTHLCGLWSDALSWWPLTPTFPVDLVPFQMQK